jgi:peptide/nickel transport system substrate-binding protein
MRWSFRPVLILVAALIPALFLAGCGSSEPEAPAQPSGGETPDMAEAGTETQPPAAAASGQSDDVRYVGNPPTRIVANPSDTPEDGGWLQALLPAEMPHLNPITSTDAYATRVMAYVFETLVDRDPETLELKPLIAKSWEISEDKLTYTFHLRDDVTFSDGTPLTAEDVKFTYDIMMDETTIAPHIQSYFVDVTSCEIIDDYTVRYTCTKPYYRHLVMIGGIEIIPKHIYGEGDFNNHPNARKPIGTGPYVLDQWNTGQSIILKRNENYWAKGERPAGHVDRRIFKIITDDNASFEALLAGDLDFRGMQPEEWVRRADTDRFNARYNKYTFFSPRYGYIGWNSRKPQFEDKMVRRALTMLLDREQIRQTIYHGLAKTVTGNFMPGTPEHNDSVEPWPFDPLQAAKLLDEAGWKDSNGDGIRDKDGVAFRFEFFITSGSPNAEQICTVYQEELRRTGIELIIRKLEWATLIERIQARNFDVVMMGWSMPPDPDPYQVWHSSQSESGSNYVGFEHEEADKIIEDARVNFNQDERVALYNRFHEIIHEEQPYTFLYAPETLLAIDKRVYNAVSYPLVPMQPRMEWFIPQDQQRFTQP